MAEHDPLAKYTVFVIPHTHWDREWYSTFQQFRVRLVHVMDTLLDLLERDPAYTHFNLDGQTIVLQDYLEIRPEKSAVLQRFVGEHRLGVGPWYVLPDEFLVSGESLVRNLQLGHRLAGEFGRVQKVGYIPDTFGHISQLPQILQGFGISYAMHFRGLDEGDLKSELWWQSPDGSQVLLRHLPTDLGYSNAAALADEIETAASDLQVIARHETRRAAADVLLALNGTDHWPPRPELPAIIEAANRQSAGQFHFQQASLEEYFAALTSALSEQPLQTVSGELRDASRTPGRDNRLVPHILSAHIYNKMQNAAVQCLLERWAEPWSAITWLRGEEYPGAFLWKAWEYLLQNHPHDSIGGCSIDPVHAQMETRFAWATEVADEITAERFQLIASKVDLSGLQDDEVALIVFNGLPWPLEGAITVDIDLWDFFLAQVALQGWTPPGQEHESDAAIDAPELYRRRIHQQWWGGAPTLPNLNFRGLRIRPLDQAAPLPVQIESICHSHILRPLISGPASERSATRFRASFSAYLPPYGYQAYAVAPSINPNKAITVSHSHNVLENEFLRVQIAANGTMNVTDKATGEIYRDLVYFEDGGDCGDGYNYSYPLEDRVENSLGLQTQISRLNDGPLVQRCRIDYDWTLPEGLDALRRRRSQVRTPCPLSVTVSLAQNSPRLDLQVTFDNRTRDHRLRIIFPSDIDVGESCASAQFDVVSHPVHVQPVAEAAWVEDAPTTFPMQDWVDLSDGKRGLCILTNGLPEYEVLETERRPVAVTLLRAVAFLGAGSELQTASGGAGPHIATPGAQIQRELTFSLSIYPHRGSWDEAEVWRQAAAHNNPPRSFMFGEDPVERAHASETGPSSRSFLAVEGRNTVFSTLKKAEAGDALVLRLYNPSDITTQVAVRLSFIPTNVRLAGLDEQLLRPESMNNAPVIEKDGLVRLSLPPKKIITLLVDPK